VRVSETLFSPTDLLAKPNRHAQAHTAVKRQSVLLQGVGEIFIALLGARHGDLAIGGDQGEGGGSNWVKVEIAL